VFSAKDKINKQMIDWLKLIFIKKVIAQQATVPSGPNAVVPSGSDFIRPTGLPTDLGALISRLLTWVLWAASVVLIYIIIKVAWGLITKKDSVTEWTNAKKKLLNALIGFVFILLAQSIPGLIRDFFSG
jgi:hypothetical protein